MFTNQDIEEIYRKLQVYAKKDSEFYKASSITDADQLSFLQAIGGSRYRNGLISVNDAIGTSPEIVALKNRIVMLERTLSEVADNLDRLVFSDTIRHIEYVDSEPEQPRDDTLYIVKECEG